MKNLFFTYRPIYTERGCRYDPSFYNEKVFADYNEAGLTKMIDGDRFIPENRITKEVVPGVRSQRKAGVLEYNENLDIEQLKADLLRTTGNFLTEIKTADEMREWIESNTDLELTDEGYLIAKANESLGEQSEPKYLVVN